MDRRALAVLLPLLVAGCATSRPEAKPAPEPAVVAPRAEVADDDMAMMERMMELHLRMAADTAIRRRMMADTAFHAAMHAAMGEMGMQGQRPGAMDPAAHARMMEEMRARVQAMTPEQRRATIDRMMAAHRRLMADPDIHARMMADPEMRRMMEGMEGMHHGHPMPDDG